MPKLFNNQNQIIFQSVPRNQNNKFGTFNKDALFNAMGTLSKNALKLYLYLGSFQELQEDFYLSKQDALSKAHMSEQAYFTAKRELKQKGYLVKNEFSADPNAYLFIESPL